ncbi:MAG: hypothetical protein LBC37_07310, partial [Zoogloeaceae bacterium]|nr:hypothetical protein [Zoogloeaceae bacterium]
MHKPPSSALTVPGILSLVFCLFFAASLLAQDCADCAPEDDTGNPFLAEAKKGDPLSMTRTALLFFREGNGAEGESWLQKAGDAGEPGALKILADGYAHGFTGHPKDQKRALDLYRQALAATTSAQAEDSGRYPPRYLRALKLWLNGVLGEAAASGEEGARDVREAARFFAEGERYAQLAGLLIQYPEVDFSLDSLSPESLRILTIELESLAYGEKEKNSIAALRVLMKLYEEDSTGVHLAARQGERWESALLYARLAEDAAATARLTKKLQMEKPAKSARPRAASGRYVDEHGMLILLDNGLFYHAFAASVPVSWEGTWTEGKGQVCLTPYLGEFVLLGRFDAEKALEAEWRMTDAIRLKVDKDSSAYLTEDYLAKAALSWSAGAAGKLPDAASFVRLARLDYDSMRMDKDMSALLTALPVGNNRMRVYRHALDPRYNDYMLWIDNPFSLVLASSVLTSGEEEVLMHFPAFQVKGKARQKKQDMSISFCGVMEG